MFELRVWGDGTEPAVSSFDQIRSDSDPSWRKGIHFSVEPREFTMNPSQGTIRPQEHQVIEECKEDSPVLYSSPKPCGIVEPQSTAEIPVIVEIQTLDPSKHHTSVSICVFGDERNPLTNKPHCYNIEPREGVIPARGEVPVTITATLDVTGFFADAVQLFIGKSLWTTFILQGFSTGFTIVVDKAFTPELNLGYQFSLLPCIHRFTLTNGGHHFHQLFWKVECNRPAGKEGQSTSALSSPKAEDDSQSPRPPTPVFGLEPLSMDLQPGESVDMVLRGFSHQPQVVQNYVMCEAVIGTGRMTKKIIETTVTCEFIDPSIEVSARQFTFRVEKKASDVLTLQYQPLDIKNTCLLPLDLMLDVEQPFQVCSEDQQPLPHGQVSDTENILGIFQAENIKVSAEVRDLSVSIDMPEGPDGSLEFGTINVLDKVKKVLRLKNKSVYNIEYNFTLKGAGPSMQDLAAHFTVEPQSGMLTASQPGVNIEMLFHPTSEIFLKDKPILYCQVIDCSSGEEDQTVTNIPVRVSARAVYSKYSIEPASPINFGAVLKGTKKTRTVMLENKGTLNFSFCIQQAPEDASALESRSSKQEESAPAAAKLSTRRKSSSLTEIKMVKKAALELQQKPTSHPRRAAQLPTRFLRGLRGDAVAARQWPQDRL